VHDSFRVSFVKLGNVSGVAIRGGLGKTHWETIGEGHAGLKRECSAVLGWSMT
jgi:hypothetical protein